MIADAAAILRQTGTKAVDGEGGNEMFETAAGEFGMEKGWVEERV